MVAVSFSRWELQCSGIFFYRFFWVLCMVETRSLCKLFGSRGRGKARFDFQSAPRTALVKLLPCRTSFPWSSLSLSGQAAAMWSSVSHNKHA